MAKNKKNSPKRKKGDHEDNRTQNPSSNSSKKEE